MAALQRGKDPSYKFGVTELLALLWAQRWSTSDEGVPCRPLVIEEPEPRMLYREPRRHKRRQKLSVGSIDRWKNSGGKRAVVTLKIPELYQRDQCNVIVQRHGRILRPDSKPQLRYRQWSFGVLRADGTGPVEEDKAMTDNILYQVYPANYESDTTASSVLSGVNLGCIPCEDAVMLGYACIDPRWLSPEALDALRKLRPTTVPDMSGEARSAESSSASSSEPPRKRLNLGLNRQLLLGGRSWKHSSPVTQLDYSLIGGEPYDSPDGGPTTTAT